ncbi:MAG: ketol-acid reductoisomerase [Firmicutes bacterium]|nr:ketol-acid reductoisomerase [Bacillota bacterium]
MSEFLREWELPQDGLGARTVAIVGYGNQGRAQAQNLRDSGVEVVVGQRPGRSADRAREDGFSVVPVEQAVQAGDVVQLLLPDESMADIYRSQVAPHLRRGQTLLFSHGFNIHFGFIAPPEGVDVGLISPKGPGHQLRTVYEQGGGLAALWAVFRDFSGGARVTVLAYAQALGCARAGLLETSFSEETETDLFGEQAVLCGGVPQLAQAAFDTLVQAGYQPEVAYFECFHELKLIVDLLYTGGLTGMHRAISDTAEYGGYEAGGRVVDGAIQPALRATLADIRSGAFARRWVEENRNGRRNFEASRAQSEDVLMERVGRAVRMRIGLERRD